MAAQVIADGVWIGSDFLSKGTRRDDIDPALASQVGSHLWMEESEGANIDPTTGVAITGLKDGVWIDGDFYAKGTVPPNDVIPLVGAHMWAQGFPPIPDEEPLAALPALPADVAPEPDPLVDQVPSPVAGGDEGAPEVPKPITTPEPAEPADPADEPGPPEPVDVEVPNRGGKGSSKAHWLEYARSQQVEVSDDMERHEVIAACVAAGVPVD